MEHPSLSMQILYYKQNNLPARPDLLGVMQQKLASIISARPYEDVSKIANSGQAYSLSLRWSTEMS